MYAGATQVDGRNIVAWVRYLEHIGNLIGVDEEALADWAQRAGRQVPMELVQHCIASADPDVCNLLRRAFTHDRTGNATTEHDQQQAEAAAADAGAPMTAGAPYQPGQPGITTAVNQPRQAGTQVQADPMVDADPLPATTGDTAGAVHTGIDIPDIGLAEMELLLPSPTPQQRVDATHEPEVVSDIDGLLRQSKVLVHSAGGCRQRPLSDSDPYTLACSFPSVFPYTVDGRRPLGMTLKKYCAFAVARVPRRQFQQPLFLARMYDTLFKDEVRQNAVISAKSSPHAAKAAGRIPRDVVRAMAEVMALPRQSRDRHALLSSEHPLVRSLVSTVRRAAAHIDPLDAFYNSMQQSMRCVCLAIGVPTLFFNVNPSSMHCSAVAVAAGERIQFDGGGKPQDTVTAIHRWRRVRNNAYACGMLVNAVITAIKKELFGFSPGDVRQSNPACFCGPTFSVDVKVEETGRKELHIHGLARVAAFCVERLAELFNGPNCRVLALAHAVCTMWMPAPYHDPKDDDKEVFPTGK